MDGAGRSGTTAELWRAAVAVGVFGVIVGTSSSAGAVEIRRPAHVARIHAGPPQQAFGRPLVIRRTGRRLGLPVPVLARRAPDPIDHDFVFRDWNETRLTRWGPFRLGGNVFYGDGRGDPINYGNADLAGIAGYGGARGGFGGPHFDSVGGFHPGPGPDVAEDDDYASGSISRPDYGDARPTYPSVTARLAALNHGVVPASYGRSELVRAAATRISTATRRPRVDDAEQLPIPAAGPVRDDESDVPDLDIGDLF